ncbi:hypothetical protein Asi02nite_43390 [Asanoa siamensis]|uniref:Uncharacterized protein n=1 Tax=Asanoa siamensis TaxID=926357 RepID=A0ABQ4CU59_9ACTN|nr:hypothetical protein Asi02nite_43390 [Asanoa siamensis]
MRLRGTVDQQRVRVRPVVVGHELGHPRADPRDHPSLLSPLPTHAVQPNLRDDPSERGAGSV